MFKILSTIFFLLFGITIFAQNTYFVSIKENYRATEKLAISEEAIQKKIAYQVPIDALDYDIPKDIKRKIESIQPNTKWSRWLFGALVILNETQFNQLLKLPFVKSIVKIHDQNIKKTKQSKLDIQFEKKEYGDTWDQLNIHNFNYLHKKNLKGAGIKIAVFYAGFKNANQLKCFNEAQSQNRIIPVFDYNNSSSLFEGDFHGTAVLGCMASFIKDTIIGAAPDATYYLFATENPSFESPIEEYHWALAAEKADSIGVHLINSSLGYTEFDDPQFNYNPSSLDGKTSISTKAAQIASEKGIIVVNSAGNQGNRSWKYLSAPADAKDVVAVGAIDINENVAPFSSRGFTANTTLKPNVCAVGVRTLCLWDSSGYYFANGTSFSAPIITGLLACMWQSNPTLKPYELKDWLHRISTNFNHPNFDIGFGIPKINTDTITSTSFNIYPNPTKDYLIVETNNTNQDTIVEISLYHFLHANPSKIYYSQSKSQYLWIDLRDYSPGLYFLNIQVGKKTYWKKIIKSN